MGIDGLEGGLGLDIAVDCIGWGVVVNGCGVMGGLVDGCGGGAGWREIICTYPLCFKVWWLL